MVPMMTEVSEVIDISKEIVAFQFPLNVYAELLMLEVGAVDYLHYGLFDEDARDVVKAQRKHTELMLERLPQAPASVLEVGIGMGTTLKELADRGYRVTGVTPDPAQIRIARSKVPSASLALCGFEAFNTEERYDVILLQESSQYIDAEVLFSQAARYLETDGSVLILDEFSRRQSPGLPSLERVIGAAAGHGFKVTEDLDLSATAAGTIDYLLDAIDRRHAELAQRLDLDAEALASLVVSNHEYRRFYASGSYQYHCLTFVRR